MQMKRLINACLTSVENIGKNGEIRDGLPLVGTEPIVNEYGDVGNSES